MHCLRLTSLTLSSHLLRASHRVHPILSVYSSFLNRIQPKKNQNETLCFSQSSCNGKLYREVRLYSTQKDAPRGSITLKSYLNLIRFDRPIGTYLLFWPCAWSQVLATSETIPSLYLLALFAGGSFLMRSAGCIINDMWDVKFDKMVERTKSRPLASGEMTRLQAAALLAAHLALSLGILFQFNYFTIALGFASMIPVIIYPLMKRFTHWPQVVLGMTLNWGALVGWAAVHGSLDPIAVLPLYLACIAWTVHYDTLYAIQDKQDDILVGVKSTAIRFGDKAPRWLGFFSGSMISLLTITGLVNHLSWPYYVAVAAAGVQLAHQVFTLNMQDTKNCGKMFAQNARLGPILFAGLLFGR